MGLFYIWLACVNEENHENKNKTLLLLISILKSILPKWLLIYTVRFF